MEPLYIQAPDRTVTERLLAAAWVQYYDEGDALWQDLLTGAQPPTQIMQEAARFGISLPSRPAGEGLGLHFPVNGGAPTWVWSSVRCPRLEAFATSANPNGSYVIRAAGNGSPERFQRWAADSVEADVLSDTNIRAAYALPNRPGPAKAARRLLGLQVDGVAHVRGTTRRIVHGADLVPRESLTGAYADTIEALESGLPGLVQDAAPVAHAPHIHDVRRRFGT